MDARVRRIFLRFSTFPEECASDFWTENYGFKALELGGFKTRYSAYQFYDEETFRANSKEYFRFFYWQCLRFQNPLSHPVFTPEGTVGPIRDYPKMPPYETFSERHYLSGKYKHSQPEDWLSNTKKNPNRRFAETIFTSFAKAYFLRGALVDIESMLNHMFHFTANPLGVKRDEIPLVKLGFSPEEICEFFKAFIFEICDNDGCIDASLVEKVLDIEVDGDFPVYSPDNTDEEEAHSNGYFSSFLSFIGGEKEGVTEERSHQVEEDKLGKGKLPAIFDGTLDRDAMARALNAAMTEQGLSVRKAADAAEVSRTDIERISKGSATLDKSADVLRNLGYELHVEVRKLDDP